MCVAALLVALAACAVLAYLWIDRSISLSHLDQSFSSVNRSKSRLEMLLANEWVGQSENEVLNKLQKAASGMAEPRPIVKREGSTIWFDEIAFNIEAGRLSSVGEGAPTKK